MFEYKLTSEER